MRSGSCCLVYIVVVDFIIDKHENTCKKSLLLNATLYKQLQTALRSELVWKSSHSSAWQWPPDSCVCQIYMGVGQPCFPISPITAQTLCQVIYSLRHLSSECLTRRKCWGTRARNGILRRACERPALVFSVLILIIWFFSFHVFRS